MWHWMAAACHSYLDPTVNPTRGHEWLLIATYARGIFSTSQAERWSYEVTVTGATIKKSRLINNRLEVTARERD